MFQVIGHNSGDSYEPGSSSNLVASDPAGLRWPVESIGPTCPASARRLHNAEALSVREKWATVGFPRFKTLLHHLIFPNHMPDGAFLS
jgi:hypothetical protein